MINESASQDIWHVYNTDSSVLQPGITVIFMHFDVLHGNTLINIQST